MEIDGVYNYRKLAIDLTKIIETTEVERVGLGVWIYASFQKISQFVGHLGSGHGFLGRIGSGVWVSASF